MSVGSGYRGCPWAWDRVHEQNGGNLCLSDYEEYPEKAAETVWDMYGRKNAANGGVMRTSVVGLWNENVAEDAERICRLTHAGPRCIGSRVIISALINSLVWHGKELAYGELLQIGDKYDSRIKPYLETARNGILGDFELDDEMTMGYTLKTMGCAIWCLYNVDNFKDGLLKIVNAGGDADTNAAVACAVLGQNMERTASRSITYKTSGGKTNTRR